MGWAYLGACFLSHMVNKLSFSRLALVGFPLLSTSAFFFFALPLSLTIHLVRTVQMAVVVSRSLDPIFSPT
jgi:hypothetical protein